MRCGARPGWWLEGSTGRVDLGRFQAALDGLLGARTHADFASVIRSLPPPVGFPVVQLSASCGQGTIRLMQRPTGPPAARRHCGPPAAAGTRYLPARVSVGVKTMLCMGAISARTAASAAAAWPSGEAKAARRSSIVSHSSSPIR